MTQVPSSGLGFRTGSPSPEQAKDRGREGEKGEREGRRGGRRGEARREEGACLSHLVVALTGQQFCLVISGQPTGLAKLDIVSLNQWFVIGPRRQKL